MISKIFFISEFLLSFFPLWIVVLLKYLNKMIFEGATGMFFKLGIAFVLIILLVSLLLFKITFSQYLTKNKETICVLEIIECKHFSLEVILTNVLPLIAFDFLTISGVIEFIVIYIILLFFIIKHNVEQGLFLEFIGYNLYKCKLKDGTWIKVFSSKYLVVGNSINIQLKQLNDQTWLCS